MSRTSLLSRTPSVGPAAPPRARRGRTAGAAGVVLAVLVSLLVGAPAASASAGDDAEPAWLRPAHLVPDLGAMDIRLSPFSGEGSAAPADTKPLLETTAAYGAVGQYGALPPGSYAVSVRPAGTPVSEPPLLSLTVELEAGQAYTVAGLGTKDQPRLERLVDDLTPPGDGSANIRLLPASLAAPSLDVRAENGPVLAQDAGLGQPTGYTTAPAGSWTIRAEGDGVSGSTELVLSSGTVYTLLVLDSEDGALVVRPVVDAVGIGTTPVGGAATGFGGLADAGPAPATVAGLAALAVLLLVGLARTRPAPALVRDGTRGRRRAGR